MAYYRILPLIETQNIISIADTIVAWRICGEVYLTDNGIKELQALKEQYGSKPCEHCRFYDGRCVLGEPEVCK